MSERWKYQIRKGLLFGLIWSGLSLLFKFGESSISEQITSIELYYQFIVGFVIGCFIIGYLDWKVKSKKIDKQ